LLADVDSTPPRGASARIYSTSDDFAVARIKPRNELADSWQQAAELCWKLVCAQRESGYWKI